MNIMEIVSGPTVNGAIIHCLLLARELARRGNRVTVVCRPGSWIGSQLADDQIETVYSDLCRRLSEMRRIAEVARQRQIDVIHTHQSRAHFFGVLLRYVGGLPCVATAQCRKLQLHWMFNDFVVAASEATGRFHRRWNLVPRRRMATIPNFADCRRIAAVLPTARQSVRDEFGLGNDPVVGVVGNVIARKGLIYLVEAMPEILASVTETRLLVVGQLQELAYVDRIRSIAEQAGFADRIAWTGHRDDVDALLAAMDICVSPSLEETLPLAILEAMAAGLPVVGAAVGGIAECIEHGAGGLLVPPASCDALSAAVVQLLQDPAKRQAFGEAARRRAHAEFSAEIHASRLEEVFTRLVGPRRTAA